MDKHSGPEALQERVERDLIQRARTGEERPTPSLPPSGSSPACQLRGLQNPPDCLFPCLCQGMAMSEEDNLYMGPLSFLLLFCRSLPSAHNNGALTYLRSAKVPTSQSGVLKRWSPLFAQTIGSGVLFGSSMELTCGWSVGPESQLGECPQVIER